MSTSSPTHRHSSPASSNDEQEQTQTPPPLQMPPEIRIFQQQNGGESFQSEKGLNNNTTHEQNYQTDFNQTPSLNGKRSFCIDALLAKNQDEIGGESDMEPKQAFNQFVNNNYKDNVILRDLNSSPDDDQMSR